jgi:hypothetical protein
MRILASALALVLAAVPAAAFACSPAPGYSVPTNLELARTADLVLLGEVVGGTAGVALEPQAAKIEVRPLSALKGLMPTGNLVMPGMYLAGPGDDAGGTSDPLAFGDAHPSAYSGACIRRIFPPGARVLFFLERVDGEWAPAGGPFSRWAEDVESEAAPWVQLASFYIEAARLAEAERNALLEEQREALSVHQDRPEALAMAADIERSLAGPAPPLKGAPPPLEQPAVTLSEAEPTDPEQAPEPAIGQSDAAADSLDEVQQAIDGFGD